MTFFNRLQGWLAAVVALSAAGCAGIKESAPSAERVTVSGQMVLIGPLTASTWTVTSADARNLGEAPSLRPALLQAIEQRSGCRITDSAYTGNGKQLDAQVDCASRLSN